MLSELFKYRRTNVSLALLATFLLVILIPLELSNAPLTPPQDATFKPIVTYAWNFLQELSSTHHPFTSKNNDVAHDLLLTQILSLANCNSSESAAPWIEISVDKHSNHSILIDQLNVFDPENEIHKIIYYESSNILVKLLGSDDSLDGLLISAHFDAVPISFGTIDDGMGIASMLATLKYILNGKRQPLRTIIFNFNNNEEFGLLGAESFVRHPWFKSVALFLNLEGTGGGEKTRPILFRGSDLDVLNWYKFVSFPFASSSFAQGFKDGLIKSQTDYYVYQREGLRGIDIAFFEPRSWYHTLRDSINWSSKGSLWMMLKNTIDIVDAIAMPSKVNSNFTDWQLFSQSHPTSASNSHQSIFFDISSKYFVNISTNNLLQISLLLAIAFPILNLIFFFFLKRGSWFVSLHGWLRLPFTIIMTISISKILIKQMHSLNPLMVSVDYIYIIIFFALVSFLVGFAILRTSNWILPIHDQKLHLIVQINLILWILTIYNAFALSEAGGQNISSLCLYIPLVYTLSELAMLMGIVPFALNGIKYSNEPMVTIEQIGSSSYGSVDEEEGENEEAQSSPNGHSNSVLISRERPLDTQTSEEATVNHSQLESDLQDQSMIVISHDSNYKSGYLNAFNMAIKSNHYDWILQFILLVPIPLYVIMREGFLIGLATHEIIQESSTYDAFVWGETALVGILLGSLCWIWIDRVRSMLVFTLLATLLFVSWFIGLNGFNFGLDLLLNLINESFLSLNSKNLLENINGLGDRPFSSELYPLKLRFSQDFSVNENSSRSSIFGRAPYVEQILLDIPYIQENSNLLNCKTFNETGMQMCSFDGGRPWLYSGSTLENSFNKYLNVSVLSNTNPKENVDKSSVINNSQYKYSSIESVLQIDVRGTRECYLSFNTSSAKVPTPVKVVTIFNGNNNTTLPSTPHETPLGFSTDANGNWRFKTIKGASSVALHKLSWGSSQFGLAGTDPVNRMTIKLEWLPFTYDSDISIIEDLGVTVNCHWGDYDQTVIVDGEPLHMVPLLDQLLMFGGRDVAWTNLKSGVIEGTNYLSI